MSEQQRAVALTMGDGAGIGPEILAKAFLLAPEQTSGCFVVGDLATLRRASACVTQALVLPPLPCMVIDSPAQALTAPPRCLPVYPLPGLTSPPAWGQVSGEAGRYAGACVSWAAQAALRGDVAALVTAPLHKEALAEGGAPYDQYPGHTELLQSEAAAYLHQPVHEVPVRMMLANDELRVVLVSIHVSLREAIERVTLPAVSDTLRIADASLRRMLGRAPRLLVAGLNPHAGEGGLFGTEEMTVIGPAVQAAQVRGVQVRGPLAPDTVFMVARQSQAGPEPVDAVIAMYHDQGLIPVKYLGVEEGVNVTLGLPLVRTSPDHGTAFDIAGTARASEASLVQAIRVAKQLAGWPR
ncbi:4-hydroxythreonine-4-phosphate dehydrogenase PdxA [Comamonas serinivorans]|uniref:4-hydroxythreonine-4-phosphate dehydrogenase PdxA n=1 Tax=Comamonas serinivorans TaxID=1082851 RepID=A0A1Y0EQL9_9BURK|nr:4-hydroxythreonine-4-phosphate dehydrogenase PdxA [Comamonas serinivorans]ARU05954.1 4-hydroxythreonine-4-phosphate dehydrogenase PdxA [Comamonas serinivorans]